MSFDSVIKTGNSSVKIYLFIVHTRYGNIDFIKKSCGSIQWTTNRNKIIAIRIWGVMLSI